MADNNTIMCINRIHSLFDELTPTEKAIAEYILSDYRSVKGLSCGKLAEITHSSPATVIRFSKKLGFDSFTEMKLSLSKQWIVSSDETICLYPDDSTAIVKQKVLNFNKDVIEGMKYTLDDESLEKAVDLLCNASQILVIGDGGSGSSARNAYDIFLQLRLRCVYVTDPFFQIMQIGQMGPEDVVFAVSNSGRSKNTYDNLRQAWDRKVPTIGIIGIPNSPMSKFLTVELNTNRFVSSSFCDSVAAQICELNAIATVYAFILRQKGEKDVYAGEQLIDAYDMKRIARRFE